MPGGSAGREGEDISTSLGGGTWTVQEYEALALWQCWKRKRRHQHWPWGRCVDGAGVGGTRSTAALEEKEKTLALALGAVHEWCRSGERLPGGSAGGREGEGTSTSLEGGAWKVQE